MPLFAAPKVLRLADAVPSLNCLAQYDAYPGVLRVKPGILAPCQHFSLLLNSEHPQLSIFVSFGPTCLCGVLSAVPCCITQYV
jgi:hypothetical protein